MPLTRTQLQPVTPYRIQRGRATTTDQPSFLPSLLLPATPPASPSKISSTYTCIDSSITYSSFNLSALSTYLSIAQPAMHFSQMLLVTLAFFGLAFAAVLPGEFGSPTSLSIIFS
jgi:hypothetical protein